MEESPSRKEKVILTKKTRNTTAKSTTGSVNLSTSYIDPDGSTATHMYEVGVDEAGRGPLFGRVYTGAVILPAANDSSSEFDFSILKDSKKFHSEKKIREASEYIKQNAIAWAISYEEADVIDAMNIRRATLQCMRRSIKSAIERHNERIVSRDDSTRTTTSDYLLLIDGNDFVPFGNYNQETNEIDTYTHVCVESGDNTYACIAAASILAKVARDDYIEKLCDQHPILDEMYSLRGNKGYGAKKHLDGIREHGITQWHRRSYGICKEFA
jgi:ribonuclease HII